MCCGIKVSIKQSLFTYTSLAYNIKVNMRELLFIEEFHNRNSLLLILLCHSCISPW